MPAEFRGRLLLQVHWSLRAFPWLLSYLPREADVKCGNYRNYVPPVHEAWEQSAQVTRSVIPRGEIW